MEAPSGQSVDEIKRLRGCVNDLVSVLALPAMWTGREPDHIVQTLLDALLGMLRLDLIYAGLKGGAGETPMEMTRLAQSRAPMARPQAIGVQVAGWLGDDPLRWPVVARSFFDGDSMSIVPIRLGLQGELGILVAGSRRMDFPDPTESLVLSVAANQAAIGLQAARLLGEQKRVAGELDRRVAQRTAELSAANEVLKNEIAERRRTEDDLKRAEEQLRRDEAFLAQGQHLSSTGTFSWRVATDDIAWTAEIYRIFEIDPGVRVTLELIGSRVHPDDRPLLDDMIGRARGDGSDFEYEHRLLMPGGSVKYLHLVGHATRDQDGCLEYIGAVQEVTERRLAEQALARARSELARVARVTTLGALTASIAHEVNQPLSGIITNASTCMRMLADDPPDVDGARETARRTIRDGHRAADVIARLRDLFTRKESATEPVDLNEATREVIAVSSSELQRNRVVVRPEFAENLPPVAGDRVQLQQVILNLLLNASDAMSGVDDRPRHLAIRTSRDDGDRVRLTVQDVGVGIEPHSVDKLFEAFYTTKSTGMGIGLSVSRSIVERHQGRLWAAPNDGPGATFAFSIPRTREDMNGPAHARSS